MKTQKLGHTGEQVSALCLGTMFFGTRTDVATSHRILDAYLDAGGTFLDTANGYAHWVEGGHGGESETLIGEWMRQRGNRSQLFIASKVGFDYGDVPRGLSARLIREEVEKSLKRLQIETIDLYYGHVDDRNTPLEETLRAFDDLVRQGKVRYVGASNYRAWRLEEARWISQTNGLAPFCCVQQRYTYLPVRPGASTGRQVEANVDLLDYCKASGLTLLAYSVLLGGSYTRDDKPLPSEYRSSDNQERISAVRAVAAETGTSPNQVVLAWLRQSTPSILPLIGASSEAQLAENIGALDVTLTDEQMQRLNVAGTR